MPGGEGTSSGVRKWWWWWWWDAATGAACIGNKSAGSWQPRLEGLEVGGVGWPRGSEVQGPPKARGPRPPRVAPPFSGEAEEVRMTGSLLCCWRSGVAAACKTNLVL